LETLVTGIVFGESPRWHDGRLWFSDWGTQEVIAVDPEGKSEVIVRVPSSPFCIDWLPDGRLLIVSARDRLLLRREPDGSLVTHADLRGLFDHAWNDIVVAVEATPTSATSASTSRAASSPQEPSRWSPPTARPGRWRTASPSRTAWS
jgi:sugar lactone lactonase YvrE